MRPPCCQPACRNRASPAPPPRIFAVSSDRPQAAATSYSAARICALPCRAATPESPAPRAPRPGAPVPSATPGRADPPRPPRRANPPRSRTVRPPHRKRLGAMRPSLHPLAAAPGIRPNHRPGCSPLRSLPAVPPPRLLPRCPAPRPRLPAWRSRIPVSWRCRSTPAPARCARSCAFRRTGAPGRIACRSIGPAVPPGRMCHAALAIGFEAVVDVVGGGEIGKNLPPATFVVDDRDHRVLIAAAYAFGLI
jgi:hypothetical protein